MSHFPVQTIEQLPVLLRALRKEAGLTQEDAAKHLGVTQQVFSSLERHPEKTSVARLYKLLRILNTSIILDVNNPKDGPNKERADKADKYFGW